MRECVGGGRKHAPNPGLEQLGTFVLPDIPVLRAGRGQFCPLVPPRRPRPELAISRSGHFCPPAPSEPIGMQICIARMGRSAKNPYNHLILSGYSSFRPPARSAKLRQFEPIHASWSRVDTSQGQFEAGFGQFWPGFLHRVGARLGAACLGQPLAMSRQRATSVMTDLRCARAALQPAHHA